MIDGRYFVPLPAEIGAAITEAIRTFADKVGLRAELWVHDLPLWFVTSIDRDAGIVRRVQIAAYAMGTADELRMIPQVFRFSRERREMMAFDRTDPEDVRKLRLSDASSSDRVQVMLSETWAATLRLAPPGNSASQAVVCIAVSPEFRL